MSDPQELFPPRPGGMIDMARQRAAADKAHAEQALPVIAEDAGEYAAVRVRDEPADLGVARTIVLSAANKFQQLLPRDERRRTAVIIAVDNPVWWGFTEGAVQDLAAVSSGGGGAFWLPAGIGIEIASKAQVWVSLTTVASSSRVSVLACRDSAP